MNPTCKNCQWNSECWMDHIGANVCQSWQRKGNPVLMLVAALGFWGVGIGILYGAYWLFMNFH